jgi:hypothetical protein
MKRLVAIFILILCAYFNLNAQESITVSGVVVDAADEEPIIGACVVIQGTLTGVVTDEVGKYAISCPANATLEFSAGGYVSQPVPVNNRSTIKVYLQLDALERGLEDNKLLHHQPAIVKEEQ